MYIVYSWTREDAPPSHTYRYRKTPESFQLSHLTDVHRTWYQDAPTALGDNSQWRQENTPRPFFKQIIEIDTLLSQLTLSFPDIEKTYIQKQPYNIIICDQCHMKIFTPNAQRRWKDAALARKQNDLTWPSWLWWYIITIILCITTTITVIIITILSPKVAAPLLTQSDVVSRAASLDPSFSSSGSFLWSLEGSFLYYYHDNCSHWIHHSLHYCLHCFHFSRGLLEGAILKSMALKEGSGRWNDNWQPPDCMLIVKTMMMIIIVIIIIIIIFIVIRTDTWLTPEKMNIKAHLTG